MAAETSSSEFRWTRRFLRADAEQPVGAMRMVLSQIRRNQWVLLEWSRRLQSSRYYPLKKSELAPSLQGASSEATVVQALHLHDGSDSQTVSSPSIQVSAERPMDSEHPWLARKVLLDDNGSPVAIGVPILRVDAGGSPVRRGPPMVLGRELSANKLLDLTLAQGSELGEPKQVQAEAPREYSIVRVFYATDRSRESGGEGYSNRRDPTEELHFGTCDVTIPRDHRLAKLESPRWWKFEFSWNPKKHIMLGGIHGVPQPEFMSLLRTYIEGAEDHSAFIFIHGFDVSFEDAARRTAQLSYDLGFKGAPILYSWPSASSFRGYPADEATIEWTRPHLAKFLSRIAQEIKVSTLHVIAHSMGNRALVKILQDLSPAGGPPFFRQVILTAPDIDTGEFLHLVDSIRHSAERVTLYASSNDEAIKLSKSIHQYPRAGESGPDIVVVDGLDTVDASAVDTGLVGHSYYAEKRTLISDLFYLVQDGKAPGERHGLESKMCAKGQYWAFRP